MKCLIVFDGNEGSSYFVNQLSNLDKFHHLGYEKYDKYKYNNYDLNKTDRVKLFKSNIIQDYNINYNNKIPFCKLRLFSYENDCNILDIIKNCGITHIILLYRYEFSHIIHYHYLKKYNTEIGWHMNLGHFDKNRNINFLKYKGTIQVNKEKFEKSIQASLNYLISKNHQINILKKANIKLKIIDFNNLINSDIKLEMESFFNTKLQEYNPSLKHETKNFNWIDLFNEESKQFLREKEQEFNKNRVINIKKNLF